MELKLREVDESYSVGLTDGIKVKPYLTIGEIDSVVTECMTPNEKGIDKTAIERYLIKTVRLVEYCTNIDMVNEKNIVDANDVYNLVVQIGALENILYSVTNAYVIDEIIDNSENTYSIVKECTKDLKKALKNFDMSKIQNGFENLGSVIKNV